MTGATTDTVAAALRTAVAGQVDTDVALAPHTTLKVGGPAAVFVTAAEVGDIAAVADVCADAGVGWLILGRGSNLLVSDAGWDGVVVRLGRAFRGVDVDGDLVVAGGAEPMPALAHTVARHGLGGLAYGVAIPGTVGGAVRMNAGAHGQETEEILAWVDVARLADGGRRERLPAAALQMTYRHTELPEDAVVVRAGFRLAEAADDRLAEDMKDMQRWRREHQPLGQPSCGSVFRNPEGDSAGRLIESAGLKGHRIGGAQVSDQHANFIVADPGTRADDVFGLIRLLQTQVQRTFGVVLVPEVVMVGFPAYGETDGEGARS